MFSKQNKCKQTHTRHILMELQNIKEKTFNVMTEKRWSHIYDQPQGMLGDTHFECSDAFRLLRKNSVWPRILYPAHLSFKEHKIKIFKIYKDWEWIMIPKLTERTNK